MKKINITSLCTLLVQSLRTRRALISDKCNKSLPTKVKNTEKHTYQQTSFAQTLLKPKQNTSIRQQLWLATISMTLVWEKNSVRKSAVPLHTDSQGQYAHKQLQIRYKNYNHMNSHKQKWSLLPPWPQTLYEASFFSFFFLFWGGGAGWGVGGGHVIFTLCWLVQGS